MISFKMPAAYQNISSYLVFLREYVWLGCNPGRGSWSGIEKFGETGQDNRTLACIFACFLTAIAKVEFLRGHWALAYGSTEIWDFPNIS